MRRAGSIVAAEAEPQWQLHHIRVGRGPHETERAPGGARFVEERLDGWNDVRPDERPPQAPAVLRVDIAGRRDLACDLERAPPWIARRGHSAGVDPRPALDRRVRVRALPGERREPHQVAGLTVRSEEHI